MRSTSDILLKWKDMRSIVDNVELSEINYGHAKIRYITFLRKEVN